jgi:hypothetical protein
MSGYTTGEGGIDGLTLRNINLPLAPHVESLFNGNGTTDGCIRNVSFESIAFGGAAMPSSHVQRRNCTASFTFR